MHTNKHLYIHIYMHAYKHTYIHDTYMNTYMNTYIHTHIHTHTTRPAQTWQVEGGPLTKTTLSTCHTYKSVMLHIQISHVTRINQTCHTYNSVILRIWTSDTHMCTYTISVHLSQIQISDTYAHINESPYHTYKWVTLTHINSRHTKTTLCTCHAYTTTANEPCYS